MWSTRFMPKGGAPTPPPNIGKTFLAGGAFVLAGLTGFYVNMLRNKHKQERDGTNPIYEQVISHAHTKPILMEDVNALPGSSKHALQPPTKEHNARHISIDEYKASHDRGDVGRYQVPPPQRSRGDGSGRVYTKSPDYARNYEKTNHKLVKDQTGRVQT